MEETNMLNKNSLLFTPILKTKRTSEYNALKELSPLISNNETIVPYIECIKNFSENDVQKYIKQLSGCRFFVEPQPEDVNQVLNNLASIPGGCILSLRVLTSTNLNELELFINTCRRNNKHFAIKIYDADDRFISNIKTMSDEDYLFVEIGGNPYSSSSFLDDLRDCNLKCNIIIHSNEREQYLKGEDFMDGGYNECSNFNFSIINAIKDGSFAFDGFGSRCGTKNDTTEDVKMSRAVYGVFLVFDYEENNFYSLRSTEKEHISKVYNSFKEKIKDNLAFLELRFFNKTNISRDVLEKYISAAKFSASKAITITIIRYIEEVTNNLL